MLNAHVVSSAFLTKRQDALTSIYERLLDRISPADLVTYFYTIKKEFWEEYDTAMPGGETDDLKDQLLELRKTSKIVHPSDLLQYAPLKEWFLEINEKDQHGLWSPGEYINFSQSVVDVFFLSSLGFVYVLDNDGVTTGTVLPLVLLDSPLLENSEPLVASIFVGRHCITLSFFDTRFRLETVRDSRGRGGPIWSSICSVFG